VLATVAISAAAVVVVGLLVWAFVRHDRADETERFHRAREITTSWAAPGPQVHDSVHVDSLHVDSVHVDAAAQPATQQPVVTKPVVTKPAVTKPAAAKPAAAKPAAGQPVATAAADGDDETGSDDPQPASARGTVRRAAARDTTAGKGADRG
jgi:hypothetical protein